MRFGVRSEQMKELVSAHYGKPVEVVFFNVTHRCAQLDDDNRCKIYDTRPQTCRDFYCAAAEGSEPHSITLELTE